jgi:5-methylcytosine-specific restriction endonuclease McrA
MRNEVLLLNSDVAPVNWLPLSSISWQNAVRLMWLDVVEVLHTYDDRFVHSPSLTIEVPAVVMLRKQVKGFRNWVAHEDSPPAYLVFLRDSFTCQYCLKQFSRKDLTIDHVTPKCYGGQTRFENCVSACSPCNGNRGHNIKIQPRTKPFKPTLWHLMKVMKTLPIVIPHPSWNDYLNWPPELVQVVPAKHDAVIACQDNIKVLNDNFDIGMDVPVEYYSA